MKFRVWSWFGPFEEHGHFILDGDKKIYKFDSMQEMVAWATS